MIVVLYEFGVKDSVSSFNLFNRNTNLWFLGSVGFSQTRAQGRTVPHWTSSSPLCPLYSLGPCLPCCLCLECPPYPTKPSGLFFESFPDSFMVVLLPFSLYTLVFCLLALFLSNLFLNLFLNCIHKYFLFTHD